jgi:hypothetical protein
LNWPWVQRSTRLYSLYGSIINKCRHGCRWSEMEL